MPDFKKHLIIYCSENQPIAEQLTQCFQQAGHEALMLERANEDLSEPISQISPPADSSIILLVTDNFLKSYGCMNGILQAAHNWGNDGKLKAIVADGHMVDEDGIQRTVSTNFDRVGNIIQYMNFWQDKYLALRKEKRTNTDDENLEDQITITKKISADVGEFLRYIRSIGFDSLDECKNKLTEQADAGISVEPVPEGAAILGSKSGEEENDVAPTDDSALVKMIENSSEELLAENADIPYAESSTEEFTAEPSETMGDNEPKAMETDPSLSNENLENEPLPNEPIKEQAETTPTFTKKELQELDAENDELMTILDEVLQDEGLTSEGEEEFKFVGEDPDNPGEFDLDSLFDGDDEDEEDPSDIADSQAEDSLDGENEILLDLEEGEEDAISPEEILERAIEYFGENQIEEGINFMEEAVEKQPTDTTLRYYHAYALASYASDYEEAKNQLETLLKQDSHHPDAWFLMAELAENQQDFEGARKCFEKVIENQPTFENAHYRLGLLLADLIPGKEEEAVAHLKTAILQNDQNADAYYVLATLLNEKLGQPENSVKHFRKTVALQPNHPFANYDLALIYHELGDKIRANEFYQKAVAVNPELKTGQNDLAFEIALDEDENMEATVEAMHEEMASAMATLKQGEQVDRQIEHAEPLPAEEDHPEMDQLMNIEDIAMPSISTEKENNNGMDAKEEMVMEEKESVVTKTVLITGASAGIGRATAEVFARNGYRVIITGRREDRLNDFSGHLTKEYKVPAHPLVFDVRDPTAIKTALDNLPEEWKQVDILVNNAGLSRGLSSIHEGDLDHWDTMIDTNIKGLLYITRAIAPQMVERREGHIINVSSIAGTEVYPGGNVYCATKAAVSSLTRAMRLDLHKHNIRVSQVSPGHVEETEFARVRFDWDTEKAAQVYENFQPLKSEDVAETIYFIATHPPHVNIQDIYMFGTQQASATMIERSGR